MKRAAGVETVTGDVFLFLFFFGGGGCDGKVLGGVRKIRHGRVYSGSLENQAKEACSRKGGGGWGALEEYSLPAALLSPTIKSGVSNGDIYRLLSPERFLL